MTTGVFSQNVGKLFSKLKLVTDNLSIIELYKQQPIGKRDKLVVICAGVSDGLWLAFEGLSPFSCGDLSIQSSKDFPYHLIFEVRFNLLLLCPTLKQVRLYLPFVIVTSLTSLKM